MNSNNKGEIIEFWRPEDVGQIELRRGFSVARPVPNHWHEEYQFCLVHSGKSELNYRGSNLPTPPDSLFVIHPGEVHSNQALENSGCSYRTMYADTELISTVASEFHRKKQELPFFRTAVIFDKDMIGQYLNLHLVFEETSSRLERQTLLMNFIAELIFRFAENKPSSNRFGKERKAVKRVYDYLTEHYAENISLEELAQIANLSPFHFNRVFSELVGMPPHSFQTNLRILHAKNLLRKGFSISRVAAETGFADQSHLNRHFKKLVVVTPGQFRQNSKNVQDDTNFA